MKTKWDKFHSRELQLHKIASLWICRIHSNVNPGLSKPVDSFFTRSVWPRCQVRKLSLMNTTSSLRFSTLGWESATRSIWTCWGRFVRRAKLAAARRRVTFLGKETSADQTVLVWGYLVSVNQPSSLTVVLDGYRSGDGLVPLEFRISAEEEALTEAFRAAEVSRLTGPPQLEPLSPVSSVKQSLIPEPPAPEHLAPVCVQKPLPDMKNTHTSDPKSADQMTRLVSTEELCSLRFTGSWIVIVNTT